MSKPRFENSGSTYTILILNEISVSDKMTRFY